MIKLLCPLTEGDLPEAARPRAITSDADARAWLAALVASGASWHPEDDAGDVGNIISGAWVRTFDDSLAARMGETMDAVWVHLDDDPCGFILAIDPPAVELIARP